MHRHDQTVPPRAERALWRDRHASRDVCATPSPRDRDLGAADSLSFLIERLGSVLDGASEAEVARRTGVDIQTLRRFLAGAADPTIGFILSLLREYDLSAEWLLFGNGPERLRDVTGETIDSAPSEDLLRTLARRLDDLA